MRALGLTLSLITVALWVCPTALANLERMRGRVPDILKYKDQGVIGERYDGYLGVVKTDSHAQALVDAENSDRKSEYKVRAKEGNVSLETFEEFIGNERISKEKDHFVLEKGKQWKKR